MPTKKVTTIPAVLKAHEQELLGDWLALQKQSALVTSEVVDEVTRRNHSERFLSEFHKATAASKETDGITGPEWTAVGDFLGNFSRGMGSNV